MADADKGKSTLDDFHEAEQQARVVVCKPFDFDAEIPPRKLIEIYGCRSYAQGFLSLTGAAGGTGKSSLAIVEELSLALGVDLFLPNRPALKCGRKKVWSMSLEDDETEHRRRVIAAMRFYQLDASMLADNYWVTYKADSPINVGLMNREDGFVVSPQVDEIKAIIREHGIEVVNVDPFVNTHSINENDNIAMNKVADQWRSIAQECNAAVGLTHHIRKIGDARNEVSAEDLRGAVSLTAAARLVRILAPMSANEALTCGIESERRRFYFWINPSGKPNIVPPATSRVWCHMASVNLDNGDDQWDSDNVGVCEAYKPADSLNGVTGRDVETLVRKLTDADDEYLLKHCRKSEQAKEETWIGYLIAEIVDLDVDDDLDKAKIKRIINAWVKAKVLEEVHVKNPMNRHIAPCLRLGKAVITDVIDL